MAAIDPEDAPIDPLALVERWLGPDRSPEIVGVSDANRGRGVFSSVVRVELAWPDGDPSGPASVVVKVPTGGRDGAAAVASGACGREALAYRQLLPSSPIAAPRLHHLELDERGAAGFVLEDLGAHRAVDQLAGLGPDDAMAVVAALDRFHRHWGDRPELVSLPVRRAAPASFDPEALAAGLGVVEQRWSAEIDERAVAAYRDLMANQQPLVEAFAAAGPPTLCHGDPRADNLVFGPDGEPIVFDWQQLAVQFAAADLAWLATTSLTEGVRRTAEADLLAAAGRSIDHYRLGLVLPGLAVLLLAQRNADDPATATMIATSLQRIGTALADHEVGKISR